MELLEPAISIADTSSRLWRHSNQTAYTRHYLSSVFVAAADVLVGMHTEPSGVATAPCREREMAMEKSGVDERGDR